MGQAIAQAGASASGAIKGTGTGIWGIIKLLFFIKARWTITILLLAWYAYGGIAESMEHGNAFPIIETFGGRILSADETLYYGLKDIEANDWKLSVDIDTEETSWWRDVKSILAKGGFIFDVIATGWFLYVIFYFWYWIFDKFNTSGKVASVLFAIFVMVFLQALYGVSMLYIKYECSLENPDLCVDEEVRYKSVGFAMTPLKGVTFLAMNLGNIFSDTLVNSAVAFVDGGINQSLNETLGAF